MIGKNNIYKWNRSSIETILVDTLENAIDSLESALLHFNREDNLKWKGISKNLVHSLYIFSIAVLENGNYENVLTNGENEDDKVFIGEDDDMIKSKMILNESGFGYKIRWLPSSDLELQKFFLTEDKKPVDKWLINFWTSMARIQDMEFYMSNHFYDNNNVPFVLTDQELKAIGYLKTYLVDGLENFIPKLTSFEITKVATYNFTLLKVIDRFVKYCRFRLFNYSSDKKRVKQLIVNCNKYRNNKVNHLFTLPSRENKNIEFKESLVNRYSPSKFEKDAERSLMITIAAYMNTFQGSIYIGVEDSGKVIGLKRDYSLLGNKRNGDGFKQKILNLFNFYIGKEKENLFEMEISKYKGKDICIIYVSRSHEPVFIKNGEEKEFYKKTNSGVQKLNVMEFHNYIKENFNEKKLGDKKRIVYSKNKSK